MAILLEGAINVLKRSKNVQKIKNAARASLKTSAEMAFARKEGKRFISTF
jgi:hypothetical protein